MLEFRDHVRGTARTPFALVEDRNVAKHTRPRASARGLHRGEALHRKDRRHVQRHRLDEIKGQAFAVRKRPLIEVALRGAVWIAYYLAVTCPSESRDRDGIFDLLEQIENELLAVAAADKIHFRALQFHQGSVEGGEDAAEGEFHPRICGADLTGENLGVG